jgi:hypothetical protein
MGQIEKPSEAQLAALYNTLKNTSKSDLEARAKSLTGNVAPEADWLTAKTLADKTTEDQFIGFFSGNIDQMMPIKLTDKEMNLLSGGFNPIWSIIRYILTPQNCRTCDTLQGPPGY